MTQWVKSEWGYLRGAVRRWQQDDGALLAAAVAYYLGLSFFPLLLTLIAGVGLLMEYTELGRSAEDQVLAAMGENLSPTLQEQVKSALNEVKDRSAMGGRLGIAGVLFTALLVFAQFERAFQRIWNTPRPSGQGVWAMLRRLLIERGVAFLMLLSIGLVVLVVLVAGMALSAVEAFTEDLLPAPGFVWTLVEIGTTLVLNSLVFTLLYRWLPDTEVRWTHALRGGIVAGIAWEVGRNVLSYFLISTRYSSAYGVVGSFIAIMLWCYYAMIVIFLGAEYIQEFRSARSETAQR